MSPANQEIRCASCDNWVDAPSEWAAAAAFISARDWTADPVNPDTPAVCPVCRFRDILFRTPDTTMAISCQSCPRTHQPDTHSARESGWLVEPGIAVLCPDCNQSALHRDTLRGELVNTGQGYALHTGAGANDGYVWVHGTPGALAPHEGTRVRIDGLATRLPWGPITGIQADTITQEET